MQICVFRQLEEIHWPPENAPSWSGQWHSKELAISDLDFDLSNTIPESEKKLSGQQDFSQKNYPGKACKLQHQRICNKCALNLKFSKFQIPPQSTSVIEIWNDWFFSSPQIAEPPIFFGGQWKQSCVRTNDWLTGELTVNDRWTDWLTRVKDATASENKLKPDNLTTPCPASHWMIKCKARMRDRGVGCQEYFGREATLHISQVTFMWHRLSYIQTIQIPFWGWS